MTGAQVAGRLKQASDLSDLHPDRRMDAKINLTAEAIVRRLREASDLRDLCLALARTGRAAT